MQPSQSASYDGQPFAFSKIRQWKTTTKRKVQLSSEHTVQYHAPCVLPRLQPKKIVCNVRSLVGPGGILITVALLVSISATVWKDWFPRSAFGITDFGLLGEDLTRIVQGLL